MKYFIFCGYTNCDNYDSLTHQVHEANSEEDVIEFHKHWLENGAEREDNQNVFFRVFQGTELSLKPVEKVTTYKLGK